ncbi:hypothetical protein VTJ83DRAFT_3509 [Remersonia thermophila]|uniref:Uncharacterized protein n=1 Tax=Remersonia thermophila TaxID=72144 RepID=A0ABR4DE60_9PEZI
MPSLLESFSKWLKLKIYQLEVTYSVYMLTPAEKFFFYSVVFLLTSLTLIASVLYLPQHVQFIINRAWFYMHGESLDGAVKIAKGSLGQFLSSTTAGAAKTTVEAVREL